MIWLNRVLFFGGTKNVSFDSPVRVELFTSVTYPAISAREVEDLFSKYGPVVQIDLKIPPRPPGYAFVEFEDPRDAEDAIHGRDGYDFDGHCLR
ncbi:hypothetical protein Bca52824_094749, partial [Brassica carinata]